LIEGVEARKHGFDDFKAFVDYFLEHDHRLGVPVRLVTLLAG
jgi:hypothetical protein